MKAKPILIKPDRSSLPLLPIEPDAHYFSESWLQHMLHSHPEILPVDEIEPVFWPLVPIGREISTAVGLIDNLFISSAGYPVIVETKLWRNSQAKREVLAQAIDYAGELSRWNFDQLDQVSVKHNQKGLIELIQTAFDLDLDQLPDENTITKNLRLGRFLILVVGDQIRSSLIGMLNFINRYPHLATNVGLVELQCYLLPDSQDELIIVPSIIAQTEIVERSIVQINLQPDVAHQLTVEQKKSTADADSRKALSEDAFWEQLSKNAPQSVPWAKTILDHFSQFNEVELQMRRSAVVARLSLPDTSQRLSLFFINTNGLLECWSQQVMLQLENAGLDPSLGVRYRQALSKLLTHKRKEFSIYAALDKVDVSAFITIVKEFMDQAISTQAIRET